MNYSVEIDTEYGTQLLPVRKRNMMTSLAGDRVEVSILEFADEHKKEAIVENIIERAKHTVVGKLQLSGNYAFVISDDKKFRKDIYIPGGKLKGAKNNDKVLCEIIRWDYQDSLPEGKIIEVLGKSGTVETEYKALIKKYNLSKTFPKRVRDEVKKLFPDEDKFCFEREARHRLDLRDKVIFTIDPVTAKDFDDAVSVEKNEKGNYLLGVHIADVSHYVHEGSELDDEALKRGTSVYLMNDVVPMLPEKLSNDICSLKPKVNRLTFSVFIELDTVGQIIGFNIAKSIIKSKRRFTYEEVQRILDEQKGEFLEQLNLMNELHKVLYESRIKEGSLDFETQEVDVVINKEGRIEEIKPKKRLESMRMIEDFMLIANKCVTIYIERKDPRPPFVYRVHDEPDKKKMRELSFFVRQFGITLNPESKRSIQKMLQQIRGRKEEYLINDITIRSMAKAIYSEENIGHYGLGFPNYTHFTSPIRRYPDLIVHRILHECINNLNQKRRNHYRKLLPGICRQSTEAEMNAVQAEREAIKILQISYLEDHIGKIFPGIISGISEFGIYVEIEENLIEGMVSLKNLHDDYYILDERNYRIVGRHRRKKYMIGDRVKVKVVKLDKERKRIDFTIAN
jgi:ribonuclease R